MITMPVYVLLLLFGLVAMLGVIAGFGLAALCLAADDGDDVDRMWAGADAIDRGDA